MLLWVASSVMGWNGGVRFFCGDETRLGLKTIGGRKIVTKGVKPIGLVQGQFKASYLYGIVEPKTGEHFFFEFSHLNTDCFQVLLNLVSEHFLHELLIIQLDNGAFHKAKRLVVPSNIILRHLSGGILPPENAVLFQPPHCPELNPIEQRKLWGSGFPPQRFLRQVWQYLKRRLRWNLSVTLDGLRQKLRE